MIGARAFIAMSWILTIFCAWVSDREPPNTVKSLANTKVLRPLTVPQPVTTPSPGTLVFSMPNSTERCSTNMSNSSKVPLAGRSSMRSRAVSLPRACCASMRFSPPPSLAPARRSSRVSRISFMRMFPTNLKPFNTGFCRRETPLLASLPGAGYIRDRNGGDWDMADITSAETGSVTGGLRTLLRLEGLTPFAGMTLLYAVWGGSWWVYALLFLVPDMSFAAYLAGPRTGAIIYNAAHSYMAPMALMTTGFGMNSPLTLATAMIWLADTGTDRPLGYGLKSSAGFGFTHLGRIGKDAAGTA